MAVSYPRGMAPAVPAPLAPQPKGTPAPPGGFQKALTHHAHVGTALKAGNAKQAMHHIGHMMLALKNGMKAGMKPQTAPTGMAALPSPATEVADGADSEGTNDAAESSALPAKKPNPFNRGAFGAMKKKASPAAQLPPQL